MIGLCCRQFLAAVIIVAGFYTFQTTGGGYHAKSHLRCLLTMIAGLLVGLSFVFLKEHPALLWALLGIGALLLLLVPLVLHPNKSHLETERKRLTIRSIVVTLSLLVSVVVLNIFWDRLLYAFSAVFLLAGVSRIAGKLAYLSLSHLVPVPEWVNQQILLISVGSSAESRSFSSVKG
ncbi:MAG: accessory gene regulator B family protein [Lachnospiraceae bacterium]|nr:accessory gene regulator B family protein [Lachnospiraceae bacterium]